MQRGCTFRFQVYKGTLLVILKIPHNSRVLQCPILKGGKRRKISIPTKVRYRSSSSCCFPLYASSPHPLMRNLSYILFELSNQGTSSGWEWGGAGS